ncbi:MAG: DUF2079 domain-containing protein [Anaerolineae bacterium]|nr:DUF2079 domain-containing protein [Anaerolineae bacterium]
MKHLIPKQAWPHVVAGGLVLIFIITFSWLAIQRHRAFLSEFDLGVYNQVVWNTLHGRIFFYTSTGRPLLHLSNHADPILLLPAPLYLLHNGPETLLVLQAALIGLAGLPVFWLGREKLKSNLAGLSLLLAYLLFPGTEVVTLSDFHPPALAFAFLMFAFYFLEKRKTAWFILFIILAMACKEQIPLQVTFLGLYALIRHRAWRLGLFTIGLGVAWFLVVMYWVIPTYSVTSDHIFLHYYADFGDNPLAIVTTVFTRPDLVLQNLWQPAKITYLRDLFTPFAFLPLLGLPVLLVGAPSFAINLLSNNPAMFNAARGHYVADVTPWLIWATLWGMILLKQGLEHLWPRSRVNFGDLLGLILLAVSGGWHLFFGYSPLLFDAPRYEVTAHDELGQRLVNRIPPGAPISAQNRLYPHLSHRTIAYVFPDIHEAEYILLDVTADTVPFHPNNYRDEVKTLLKAGEFGIVEATDGYILLQRGAKNATLPDSFYDFARVPAAAPQYPLDVQFGDELRLLGFDVLDEPRWQETGVRFYWQALKPIKSDLRLYPFFMNQQGAVIEDTSLRPMTTQLWYPPQQWSPGEIVISQTLPWTLGQQWSLAVGVLAGQDWAQWNQRLKVWVNQPTPGLRRFETNTWARLASFERQGRQLTQIVPSDQDLVPPNEVEYNLGHKMKLLGYGVSQEGQALNLTLYWEALELMGHDYTVFAHLLDIDGNLVAQHDGQPEWDVSIPTTTWQPGEKLRDRHVLPLPPGLSPGTYYLRVGVYYWQTLERLPVLKNGAPVADVVELGPVTLN